MTTDYNSAGLEERYEVTRLTPSSRGIDHDDCDYFVLDLTHDTKARMAAIAYANSVSSTHPQLAADLRAKVEECRRAAGVVDS